MYLAIVPPIYGLQRASVICAISRGATGAYAGAMTLSAACSTAFIVIFTPHYGWRAACFASMGYLALSAVMSWAFTNYSIRPLTPADDLSVAEAVADLQMAG